MDERRRPLDCVGRFTHDSESPPRAGKSQAGVPGIFFGYRAGFLSRNPLRTSNPGYILLDASALTNGPNAASPPVGLSEIMTLRCSIIIAYGREPLVGTFPIVVHLMPSNFRVGRNPGAIRKLALLRANRGYQGLRQCRNSKSARYR